MKWLSNRFRTVFWCMTLGAVILGLLSVVLGSGHRTTRTEAPPVHGAGLPAPDATARTAPPAAAAAASHRIVAGCNEALDALALCALPKTAQKHLDDDVAAPAQPAPAVLAEAATESADAPFPLLPVLAFGMGIAGALLGTFNFCAILLKQVREDSIRQVMAQSLEFLDYQSGREVGILRRSVTAAVAKERLSQHRA